MKQFFGKKSRSTLSLVLIVSLALHVVAIVIFGTIKFVSDVMREETVFEAAPIAPPPQKEPEYTVNIQQRNQSTPPPRPPAIVVNNPSELDIPSLDIDVNIDSSSVYGRGGGGFGGGLTGVREMALDFKLTDFGYSGRAPGTLEGTLIDLKRDRSGKPVYSGGIRRPALREFCDGEWKLSRLTNKFFSAKDKRYASFWMVEFGPAERAPEAFGVTGIIEPEGIAAYYEGQYTPQNNMEMRFVGAADDIVVVNLDSKIVFDGSGKTSNSTVFPKEDGPRLKGGVYGRALKSGPWIELKKGRTYDLKVLVAEVPGGNFGVYLCYQIKGKSEPRIFTTKPLTGDEKAALRSANSAFANFF